MKEIKLFVDFEFTSLSPDAQPISVGIVSETTKRAKYPVVSVQTKEPFKEEPIETDIGIDALGRLCIYTHGEFLLNESESKSFYAEFTDFDISRCDDWVKENVVAKLQFYPESHDKTDEYDTQVWDMCNRFENVKIKLRQWLSQFSDYKIQFVVDCGTWDWYWLLQLLAEWEEDSPKGILIIPEGKFTELQLKEFVDNWKNTGISVFKSKDYPIYNAIKRGLPKLPSNVSPVPMDLNDLIAFKKGISVSEAFDLNREELAFGWYKNAERNIINKFKEDELAFFGFKGESKDQKHNAMWDAKVIKAIYEQLNS